MLTWTQESDGWRADGFRIELRAPRHWVLVDTDAEAAHTQQVSTLLEPLAEETTLSQCKRQAAIVAGARERSALRRRHAKILLLTAAATILLIGNPPDTSSIVIIAAMVISFRSLGVILGSWTWNNIGQAHEVFYQ